MDTVGVSKALRDAVENFPGTTKMKTKKYIAADQIAALRYIEMSLSRGVATEIIVRDDRGGVGVIEVFVTEPK